MLRGAMARQCAISMPGCSVLATVLGGDSALRFRPHTFGRQARNEPYCMIRIEPCRWVRRIFSGAALIFTCKMNIFVV